MRYNMLDAELKAGADDREIASILMTSGETLRRADATAGGENDQFFRDQSERMLEMAVLPLRLATGTVRANDLQRFISGAAMTANQLHQPEWKQGFHSRTLEAAFNGPKTEIEKADMEQCTDYWLGQVPNLNDRTKTSIMIQVQGILHVMGSGVVRNLLSRDDLPRPVQSGRAVAAQSLLRPLASHRENTRLMQNRCHHTLESRNRYRSSESVPAEFNGRRARSRDVTPNLWALGYILSAGMLACYGSGCLIRDPGNDRQRGG